MFEFIDVSTLAEEHFHPSECDNEEYNRIFTFVSPYKLIRSKSEALEGSV
jgi:hypothetical protein